MPSALSTPRGSPLTCELEWARLHAIGGRIRSHYILKYPFDMVKGPP
jgi:hypothetical protein